MDETIYKENILDHYSYPHNKQKMKNPTTKGEGLNANCGDEMTLYLKIDDDKVKEASFIGEGCAISLAGASMLTDKIKGMGIKELKTITPGTIYTMLGIHISPSRTNCALLAYEALGNSIKHINE